MVLFIVILNLQIVNIFFILFFLYLSLLLYSIKIILIFLLIFFFIYIHILMYSNVIIIVNINYYPYFNIIVFLQEDHHILIGDFGLAKKIVTDSSYLEQEDDELMGAGTYLYASPEQLSEHRCYDNKTDIYSLGILLFEMLCPFSTGMERVKTLMDIRQGKFSDTFIKTWPREFLLIKSLLHPDPMERPTALEILDSEILLNSYPLSDTTDLLVALDLHINPEQSYNKNNIELNHYGSNLSKKYSYQNNSNSPSISSLKSIRNNEGKNNINLNNSSDDNILPCTPNLNQSNSTAEIKSLNGSINAKCNQCQEKSLIISSYKEKCQNYEDNVKELESE